MNDGSARWLRLATGVAIVVGILVRLSVVVWTDPWGPHHPDEHLLPLDAIALWEGVVPREIGWPASTTRLVLSTAAAGQWLAEEGRAAWQLRATPDRALETVTAWIARRYVDPTPLYKLGRVTSIVTGILQVIATAWALSQWVGPGGVAVGTLAAAIAPVSVLHSQYVLADITGLLFVTILVGLAAKPTPRQIVVMGALAGLGASSKFHFGLWLLSPLLCIWLRPGTGVAQKWRITFLVLAVSSWVVVTFVPWSWQNPLLALKEFAGVVLVKIGREHTLKHAVINASVTYVGFGTVAGVGALAALMTLGRSSVRRIVPLLVPLLIGTAGLLASATVFDRYGLIVLPGVLVLAALGWEGWFLSARRPVQAFAAVALASCVGLNLVSLVHAERIAGEVDVDALTKQWILTHVPRGRRVAVHDEDNAFLPRTAEQLRACVEHVGTPDAYREKWLIEGVQSTVGASQPMRSMVLNDEAYLAYWCRRELDAQQDMGFFILSYHETRRFGAVLEQDAVNEFRSGSRQVTGGVDVLVMNRPIDVGWPPAQVFRTERGQRVVYVR